MSGTGIAGRLRAAAARLAEKGSELGAETVEIVVGIALVCGVGGALYGLSGTAADAVGGAGSGIKAAFTGNATGTDGDADVDKGDVDGGDSSGGGSGGGGGSNALRPGNSTGGNEGGSESTQCDDDSHSWGDWKVAQAATCTEDGLKVRYCSKCGKSEQAAAYATGHSYVETQEASPAPKEATCTTGGVEALVRHRCSSCGSTFYTGGGTTAALGHDYSTATFSWSGTSSATATFTCSRDASHTETKAAAVTSKVTEPATCTEKGTTTYTAKAASSTGKTASDAKTAADVAVDPGNHDYEAAETATDADGTEFTHYVCSRDKSHQYWHNGSTGKDAASKEDAGYVDHSFSVTYSWSGLGAAASGWTCTATRYCSVHGKAEATSAGTIESTVTKAATCTAPGTAEISVSAFDRDWADPAGAGTKTAAIGALGHDYEWKTVSEATCTTAGTREHTCTRCGDVDSTQTTAAGGHSYYAYSTTPATAATCTAAGAEAKTTYRCSKCGSTYSIGGSATKALGHSFGSVTYANASQHVGTCTRCGATSYSSHSASYATVEEAATCTSAALYSYTCACGYEWEGRSGSSLGHSYGSAYTSNGSSGHSRSCTRCGASTTSSHSFTTSNGWKTCSLCGYSTYAGGGSNSYVSPTGNTVRYYVDGKLVASASIAWKNTSVLDSYSAAANLTGWNTKTAQTQSACTGKCPTCGYINPTYDEWYHYHASGTTADLGGPGYYDTTCKTRLTSNTPYCYSGKHGSYAYYDATCGSFTSSSSHSTSTAHSSSKASIVCNACDKAATHYYCSSCGASNSKCYTTSKAGTCSKHPKKTMSSRKFRCAKCSTKSDSSFTHYYCSTCGKCYTSKCSKTTAKACSVYSAAKHTLNAIQSVQSDAVEFMSLTWTSGSASAVTAYNSMSGFSGWCTDYTCKTAASASYGYTATKAGLVFYGKTGGTYYRCSQCGKESPSSFNHYYCTVCAKCYDTSAAATHWHFEEPQWSCKDIICTGSTNTSGYKHYCAAHDLKMTSDNVYYCSATNSHRSTKYYCTKHSKITSDSAKCSAGSKSTCAIMTNEYCTEHYDPYLQTPLVYTSQKVTS